MAGNKPDILIILINYFNDKEVRSFISEVLKKQKNSNYYVVVVNNGSKDPEFFNEVKNSYGNLSVVNPGINLGYLNGAKAGFDFYVQAYKAIPSFTIVCNTDIEIDDEFFLEKITADKNNSDAGVIGPDIFSSLTKHRQNPMYAERPSQAKIDLWVRVFHSYPMYVSYQLLSYFKRYFLKKESIKHNPDAANVYAVHGSFMIFSSLFFAKGCTLKYPGFLYGEELFIAEQCLKNNVKTYFNPRLKLVHAEHSTSGIIKNRKHVQWLYQSLKFIAEEYFKPDNQSK